MFAITDVSQRIELGEIEHAALRTAGCRTAVAEIVEGALVVFCVRSTSDLERRRVLDECRKWLPAFMVPADVSILDELPYLDSGKADRKALRARYEQQRSLQRTIHEQISPQLEKIMQITSEVLRAPIDSRTHLSTVGLDSLTAIRLASELQRSGFPRPDATDLLATSTAGELEEVLNGYVIKQNDFQDFEDQTPSCNDVQLVAHSSTQIPEDGFEEVFAATPTQTAMISRTMQDKQAYCNYVELGISFPVSFQRLSRSIQDLARHHSLLRSGFVATDLPSSPYAVVVWKGLKHSQIRQTQSISRSFTIKDEVDLLRPCSFQIVEGEDSVCIGIQIHHALYDQWAVDLLYADLGALLKQGRLDQQPSFRDVAADYWNHRQSHAAKSDLEFWHAYLQDLVPSPLPSLNTKVRPRILDRTPWQRLNIDLVSIKEQSQAAGYSAATVFQSAMSYLFASLVGSTDVAYGVVHSGRHLRVDGIDRVFGPCLNTLPLRVDLSTIRTCCDLLRLVHTTNQSVQRHSKTSLAEILANAESLQGTATFDTLFVWQESTVQDNHGIVKEVESIDNHEYSLVVELRPLDDGVDAKVTYRQDLMNARQVQTFLEQLGVIASAIASQQESNVKTLSRQLPSTLQSISNPSPSSAGDGHSLFGPLRAFAESDPTSPAIVFAHEMDQGQDAIETLSYHDLNAQSDLFAAHLQAIGLLPGELVCICMEKSARLYVSIIGTLKAGAGYLPLIPETPRERILSILNQSNLGLCVCDNTTHVHFANLQDIVSVDVTKLDLDHGLVYSEQPLDPQQTAYTVFTSGSTGEPKGVAVTVENLLGNLQVLQELYKPSAGDRLLQACSHAFDVSVFEIFFTFYTGMCLCSATKDVLFRDLEDSINKLQISHLSLTPTVAALVDPSNVPSVRFLVTAGEAVTGHVHRKWAGRGLHQGYGPSELTNICTINMHVAEEDALGNIGQPFRNTSAFVISSDDEFEILPAGAFGEFAFGGEQVFRGYIGRDDLNANKIVTHPRHGRIYRSGDMGRMLHDGSLLISGRLDDQVKIRGNRVELGEINSVALQDPWIHDCTTILIGDSASQQSLVAFVVPNEVPDELDDGLPLEVDESHMHRTFGLYESSLPPYMIPSNIIPITHLPRTSQGKLDRRRLQDAVKNLAADKRLKSSHQSPCQAGDDEQWSPLQRRIAEILAKMLEISSTQVALNQSFLALGLNSLNAIAFTKKLSKDLHLSFSISEVFRNATIARLADIVQSRKNADQRNGIHAPTELLPHGLARRALSSHGVDRAAVQSVLPCTPLQHAMLSAKSFSRTSSYCNRTVFRINGEVSRLIECWKRMVERHAILRTRFVPTDDKGHPYIQIVLKEPPPDILQYKEPVSGQTGIGESPSINHTHPLHILVMKDGAQTTLCLFMHHAIYDGMSTSILLKEIESQYHEQILPESPSLEQYLIEMQKHQNEEAEEFWASRFAGFIAKPFPRSPRQPTMLESTLRSQVYSEEAKVVTFCKRHAISVLDVFQTALAKCLAHCQNEDDVCFGNVVSGRTVPVEGIESLVAPCFNTIPIRAKVDGSRSNLHLARTMNTYNANSSNFQLTPLRKIQSLSRTPERRLFDALLLLQPPPTDLDDDIWNLEEETGTMDLPVVFELTPSNGKYGVQLHFQTSHLSDDSARTLLDLFVAAVDSVIESANGSVNDLGIGDVCASKGMLATQAVENGGQFTDFDDSNSLEEDKICNIFADLAGIKRTAVDRQMSMYQLGLDSLNAAQVAAKLRASGIDVDATDVMETLTPQALAALAVRKTSGPEDVRHPVVDLGAFESRYRDTILQRSRMSANRLECIRPCTSAQCGMIAQSINSCGQLYVNHVTFDLPRSIECCDLIRAWGAVAAKHQVLRTGFHEVAASDTPFAMAVWSTAGVHVPVTEMRDCSPLDVIEKMATETAMASLSTLPWHVTFQTQPERKLMVLTVHHALYDANSLRLILRDLSRALSSTEMGSSPSIDDALITILTAQQNTRQEADRFWTKALHGSNASLFPSLAPTSTHESALVVVSHTLRTPISRLDEFCRRQNATIQALGQSAWAMLLASYIGDPTVVFGIVLADHSTSPTDGPAFPSISTIPIVCNTENGLPDVLSQMVKFNTSAHRHRFTPLADIQKFAGHPGEQLFDTVFVYQKSADAAKGVDWPVVRETASVEYALSIELEIGSKDCLDLRLTFDESRIPLEHAELLLRQFEHVVDGIVGRSLPMDPQLHSMLPPKETTLPSPSDSVHGLVVETVKRLPNQTALEFVITDSNGSYSTSTWTYEDLDQRANQVVALLQRSGVKPGDTVAVCMEKCPEASFAFYGVLKAGCAFLAIDPDLPESRQQFILQDSGTKILLVGANAVPDAVSKLVQTIVIEEEQLKSISAAGATSPPSSGSDTCYCLYTSGTTGTPKGCEISHENTVQAMMAFQRLFAGRWTEASRWLQFASYWFDVSVLEQFWSWSVGITVVGAPRDLVLEDIPGFIQNFGITHIDLTPSLARLVHPSDVPSLWGGVFITGGEALKQEIIDEWGPKATICNGYGPTEATIGVTMNRFIESDAKPSNIGRQFDNVGTYVLSPAGDLPVFKGAVGELCVSGKLVGKGYLNRPDLTAASFPFLSRFGERVYRTGDLVRMLSDGSFTFIGRKDSQTKLRGQRLELAEIDKVLLKAADGIAHAVSLVVTADDRSKETLVSYFTVNSQTGSANVAVDSSDQGISLARCLRETCIAKLPGYMVPTHVIPITLLPLTVNNKVDSKGLTSLYQACSIKDLQTLQATESAARALDDTEVKIVEQLEKLLRIDISDVTPQSNTFSLGMSSISAIPFATSLKQVGFTNADVATILRNPTLAQLSAALSMQSGRSATRDHGVSQAKLSMSAFNKRYLRTASEALQVDSTQIETVTPCTPLQQGLILESRRQDERPYFNSFHYQVTARSTSKVLDAFQELINHTQILRASFIETDDGFAQAIFKRRKLPIQKPSGKNSAVKSALRESKRAWIERNEDDLVSPFEVVLFQSGDRDVLAIHIHHALYDGISFDMMLEKIADICSGRAGIVYGPDFTEALPHGPLRQVDGQSFWKQQLRNVDVQRSLPAKGKTRTEAEHVAASLKLSDTTGIEEARKRLGVSHQSVIQTCFEVALRRNLKSLQLYGMVVSGRSIEFEGADRVLGPMFNTLPQSLTISPDQTISGYVRNCHDRSVETLPYQHTPMRNIKKWCEFDPSASMFNVLFVFQHENHIEGERLAGPLESLPSEPQAEYPLACEVLLHRDGSLEVSLLAQGRYFEKLDLLNLLETFEEAVNSLDSKRSLAERFNLATDRAIPNPRPKVDLKSEMNGVHHFEWTDRAEAVRSAMASVANVDTKDIDEHTTLLALGLDSIDSVKLSSRLRSAGLTLPVSQILRSQTIPRMLDALHKFTPQRQSKKEQSVLETLEKQLKVELPSLTDSPAIERILPATPQQEGLISDMLRTELREYFNHDVVLLRSETDSTRLQEAWETVVNGSPILRTLFSQVDNPEVAVSFAQIVQREYRPKFQQYEKDSIDELPSIFEDIRSGVLENIDTLPPLRISFLKIRDERYMILSLSHAQYDGQSLMLLHEDLKRAYANAYSSRPSYDQVIEPAINARSKSAERFWSAALAGTRSSPFPVMLGANESAQVHRREVESKASTNSVREFCRNNGVSMQALAETCWALTLAHYTRSTEVVFGVVLACRDSADAQEVMFPTMNTIAMPSSLHGTRVEMLQYMQSLVTDVQQYQRTPLRAVKTAVSQKQRGPLFDTLFIYQKSQTPRKLLHAPLYDSVAGSSDIEYPVAVELEDTAESIVLRAACKSSVCDETGTQQLLQTMDQVLNSILSAPQEPTVSFGEMSVSICGLDPFVSKDQEEGDESDSDIDEVSEKDDSLLLAQVMEVLAQVAKVPVNELDACSTIESIGVDSISSIKVVSLLKKRDIHVSVSTLLRARTAGRIAEAASSQLAEREERSATVNSDAIVEKIVQTCIPGKYLQQVGIQPSNVAAIMPATAGQIYMLNMWQKSGGQIFYPTFTYQLNSDVSPSQIESAWKAVVAKHAILRTVFCATTHERFPTLQIVLRYHPEESCGFMKGPEDDVTIAQPMATLRAKRTNSGCRLILKIHHALYDAVSLPLITRDFAFLLEGPKDVNIAPNNDRPRLQDYIAASMNDTARQARKNQYSQYLSNVNLLRLRQPEKSGQQKRVNVFRPFLPIEFEVLTSFARKQGLSVQAILFAAYAKIYASLAASKEHNADSTASQDVLLGIYMSNRGHIARSESLPAPLVNIVPLLVRSPGQRDLLDISKHVQADLNAIGTVENSAISLLELKEWTGFTMDTIVNFLRIPEAGGNDDKAMTNVLMTEDSPSKGYATVEELDAAAGEVKIPQELSQSEGVHDAYKVSCAFKDEASSACANFSQHTLDVEIAITKEGKLDVGLFCPEAMLSLSQASEVIEELSEILATATRSSTE